MSNTIHNIGILAHVDAGKTTLTEQLLFLTGALRTVGSVDAGTTATDTLSVEKQRGISVRAASASCEWNGVKINIIDTPGHIDFAGEVERTLHALDYAVVVISAVDGVRAHTENILHSLQKANLPFAVFINKTDRTGSDIQSVLNELKDVCKQAFLPLSTVANEGTPQVAVSVLSEVQFAQTATEVLADINEEAEEAFLNDTYLSATQADCLIKQEIAACRLVPVLCGSAKLGIGVKELADVLTKFLPSSDRRKTDDLCGIIYKIEHDKTQGKIAHIRLFGGELENRKEITLFSPDMAAATNESDAVATEEKPPAKEKISQIKTFNGAKRNDSGIIRSGDIAAVSGLTSAKTGMFVGSLGSLTDTALVHPFLRVKVTPADGDAQKIPPLAAALKELSDEEPYLDAKWENGLTEITINTTGKIQLEVLDNLLKERYDLHASFSPPTVIYKETPTAAGTGGARYTMPKPCWACVDFHFEPMPRGYGVSYHGKLPFDQCQYRYQAHIHTSFLNTCIPQGLYGWEVTDFKCTLAGGEHHLIHTHPLDFFVATPMAFMNTLQNVGSTILEPLLKIRITAPADLSGKILGEIVKTGGECDSPVMNLQTMHMEAIVPVATSMDLPTKLAVLSSGKAVLSQQFYGYRECRDGLEHISPRRGVDPLDRSKWILWARGAYQ